MMWLERSRGRVEWDEPWRALPARYAHRRVSATKCDNIRVSFRGRREALELRKSSELKERSRCTD